MIDDLVSAGRAALVSASTFVVLAAATSTGGARQKAGGGLLSDSVTDALRRSGEVCGGNYSDEKDGGAPEGNMDEEAVVSWSPSGSV